METKNIAIVSDAYMCSNCGACSVICPTDAINYEFSAIGRLYAKVDSEKCISCGLCKKCCPSLDMQNLHNVYSDRFIGEIKKVWVGSSTDKDIFKNSQSGGACSAVIKYLFDIGEIDGALVCEMEWGFPPRVRGRVIKDAAEISHSQKSCYTPVDILSELKNAKNFKSIAVVGLPCQIEGLESLIRLNKIKNVAYKLGLVCDRTLCNTISDVFGILAHVEDDYKIAWRHKLFEKDGRVYDYSHAPVTLITKNDKISIFPNQYRFLLKDFFTSPRCRVCYDKINIFADIVFGDPWRMPDTDERNGESLIIGRTNKGCDVIDKMAAEKLLICSERPASEAIKGQLIPERKISVASFSRALSIVPYKIDSYLYHQYGEECSQKDIATAEKNLNSFIHYDTKSKTIVIDKALRIIKKASIINKIKPQLLRRVIKKFLG